MDTEIKRDESGKIVDVLVGGKPVKRGHIRGIKKAQETSYWKEILTEAIGVNQFSGVEVRLSPLEATVYNFCMEWYNRYATGRDAEAPTQCFDDMKYFLMELNSAAYFDLLD